ncbi:hypothetical protein [Consotaella aegiceratis]|uniref:hypothetical protein n=1 Tax=Consotaella aegiceratis TaxID=3097961 RepID=UPI002F3F4D21
MHGLCLECRAAFDVDLEQVQQSVGPDFVWIGHPKPKLPIRCPRCDSQKVDTWLYLDTRHPIPSVRPLSPELSVTSDASDQ